MALLNPPQTLPQVMQLTYRYLLHCEKQTEDVETLRALLAPPSLRQWQSGGGEDEDAAGSDAGKRDSDAKEQRVVRIAYNALRELGVISESDGHVQLSRDLPAAALSRETGEQQFRRMIRDRVLEKNANQDLWVEESDDKPIGPRDLTRALAWTLAQNVYQPLRHWKDSSELSVQHLQQRQLGQEQRGWVFSNDTRWAAFMRWAVYLGFAWKLAMPKSGSQAAQVYLVPDPTEAVRDVLPRVLPKPGVRLALPEFLEQLANELPILDGGEHREAVLARVDGQSLTLPNEGELSTALAHALLRLADEERITLFNESDTDKRMFPLESGELRPYSHIRIEKPPAAEARS